MDPIVEGEAVFPATAEAGNFGEPFTSQELREMEEMVDAVSGGGSGASAVEASNVDGAASNAEAYHPTAAFPRHLEGAEGTQALD